MAAKLSSASAELWALRADDPDKNVAGRIWTTEVTIGHAEDGLPRLGVRLLASTSEPQLDIEPHAPGFLQQLVSRCGLQIGGVQLRSDAWIIASNSDVDELIELIQSPTRRRPVFVATGDERGIRPDLPLIDSTMLARATIGLAHTVVVPSEFTFALTDAFGKQRSVYHGGVRAYAPGFDVGANPFEHRLFLGETLANDENSARCVRALRQFAARESLIRLRLGHDVLTFNAVRSAALRYEIERRTSEGASESDLLTSARAQVQGLEDELKKSKAWEDQLAELHDEVENRAIAAEAQLRGHAARIFVLEEKLKERGENPDISVVPPASWSEFVDWCDANLSGRVALTPSARNSIKKAEFKDVGMAARALLWLANDCRTRRIEGGGTLSEHPIEDGVRNSSCGGDTYEFDYQGQRMVSDWHIKNGGNTRDPSRCLRIYYGWDAQAQKMVVSDMPAHRRTRAS
jgi:hypothetical protein